MVINLKKKLLHQPVITCIQKQDPEGSIAMWSFNYNNFILSCIVHGKQTGEDLYSFYAHLFCILISFQTVCAAGTLRYTNKKLFSTTSFLQVTSWALVVFPLTHAQACD